MHAQAPKPRNKEWHARLGRSGYFFGAVLLHLVVFLMVATLVIWNAPVPPSSNADFHPVTIKVPPAPIQPPATGSAANNPQFDTTTAKSTFTMAASKDINQALTHASDQLATGSGAGPAGGGTGTGAGSGFFWLGLPRLDSRI